MGNSRQHIYTQSKNLGIKSKYSEDYLTASKEKTTEATEYAKTDEYKLRKQIIKELAICLTTKSIEIPAELS